MGTDLGAGVHKARLAITSKRRGKSGGACIITYTDIIVDIEEGDVYLLTMYDKAKQSSITDKKIKSRHPDLELFTFRAYRTLTY